MSRAGAALLALAALTAGACGFVRRTPEIRYYVLEVPGSPPVRLDAPVRLGAFSADPPYASARIAYRTSPYRLDYYTYHRWAADPRQMVAAAARDYLERAASRDGGPPYVIEGNVRRLEEVDEAHGRVGAIALEVRVRQDERVVLEGAYAETEPAQSRSREDVAAALSRGLGRILDQIAGELAARD